MQGWPEMGVKRGEVLLGKRHTFTQAQALLIEKHGLRIEKIAHYPTEMPYTEILQDYFEPRPRYFCPVYASWRVIGRKMPKPAPIIDGETGRALV